MIIAEDQREEIKAMVSDILEIEPDELTTTSLFKEDHEADSLLAIEVLAALEKAWGITIPQDDLSRMVNLEGVYAVVADATAGR